MNLIFVCLLIFKLILNCEEVCEISVTQFHARGAFRCLYLRCNRVTAGRGGTTATAGTASLRPSHCSGAAELSGTVGAGPGLGPGDPEGSTGPEGGDGGNHFELQCLNRAESAEIH